MRYGHVLAIHRVGVGVALCYLLDAVQRANIFGDSKLFVDMPCRFEPEEVLKRWSHLPQQKSPAQIRAFVAGHFDKPGLDLVRWAPTDAQESPPGLAHVQTPELQEWGDSLNRYWAQLGRATAADVTANIPEIPKDVVHKGFAPQESLLVPWLRLMVATLGAATKGMWRCFCCRQRRPTRIGERHATPTTYTGASHQRDTS